jgi:NAD(P)H-nitrite reductase large subunit
MKENYMVCNCKQVRYSDIADALQKNKEFSSVIEAFESVKEVTCCSTGCGGCHDKVMGIISDILMGHEPA